MANYYNAEDFQGLGNLNYKVTLHELEVSLQEIILNLKLIQKNSNGNISPNVYFSSIFNKEVDPGLLPLQNHIKALPEKINYLTLELNTVHNRFLNFEFPFIEMLSDKDIKTFQETKRLLTEDALRHYQNASQIIKDSEKLAEQMTDLFLRKKKVAKYKYVEYMVMSESNSKKLTHILTQVQSLHSTIIDHSYDLQNHRRITNNIFDSFKRKLSYRLEVTSAQSFKSAFQNKVIEPLNQLREKILKDAAVLNVEKNAFTYNYYLNQLYRAFDYSKALNFIGPDYLPEHQLGQYRGHEQAIDFKLLDYFEKPGAIRSLISFLESHYSINNHCKLLF